MMQSLYNVLLCSYCGWLLHGMQPSALFQEPFGLLTFISNYILDHFYLLNFSPKTNCLGYRAFMKCV
jgi:hypothetical protein